MFTNKIKFGGYWTIVLGSKQPSFEKIAALVFHSINLTTDGSRLFLVVVRNKFHRDKKFWYLSNESLQQPKKGNFFASFYNFESRCKKTVTLLIVGIHVHQGTDIQYLSNDSFGSSTTFNREDCPFGVSFNKLNDRWKQTVFSSSCPQKNSPGHEVSVAIKQESLKTFFWKKVSSISRSIIWSAGAKRLLYC